MPDVVSDMQPIAQYAVIGNPIDHSLSPEVHTQFAQQTGIRLAYGRSSAPVAEFAHTVQRFFASGGCGLNVTAPFKGQAAAWVDELDAQAALSASVNTIAVQTDDQGRSCTRGYSTDGVGLVADLREQWRLDVRALSVLVLGAGGAARAIIPALLAHSPHRLVIANRTPVRAQALVDQYQGLSDCELNAQSFHAGRGHFDVVINATAGLFDAAASAQAHDVRESLAGALCYDLNYRRAGITRFAEVARRAGAHDVRDGLGMLVWQAAYSFEIWHGVLPDAARVLASLR